MNLLKRRISCLVIAALTIFAAACTKIDTRQEQKLTVTATTTMLYDLAKEIGGDCVNVEGLMGSGVDPHQYRASASDITKMQNADVVVYNGLYLEGKMGEVFSSLENTGKTVICVGDSIDEELLIMYDGVPDPHIWFDVSLWTIAAEAVAEGLENADPANAAEYEKNLCSYKEQLQQLDEYIRSRISELSEQERILVTAHDAFGYFGRAYGIQVLGLQGINTSAEAGTADVSVLAEFIAENQVKAVFIESSLPVKSIEALIEAAASKGFETALGGTLYSDSLGDAQSGTDTYITAFKHNVDVITQGLKGGGEID